MHEDKTSAQEEENVAEERRLRKRLRRAKKLAKSFEEIGNDANSDDLGGFLLSKYPIRECKFAIPGMSNQFALNPVVTFIAMIGLWGIVAWCSFDSANAMQTLVDWRSQLSSKFTWIIQGTKGVFFFFMMYVAYKYGNIKLGRKHEKPEFSNIMYSIMIFAAGAGNAILSYSVSEPMSHQSYHFFAQAGYRSQDEIDMFAINTAIVGWGLGGWASFSVVTVAMSVAYYRFHLPLTFRSCFYPILGRYTWGWIGDVIDAITVMSTICSAFSNLGLAAMSFVACLVYMGWIDKNSSEEYMIAIQIVIIWVITILSLISVVSGPRGVMLLCVVAVGLSSLLTLVLFYMEDTKYLLNLQVQATGYYLQTSVFQLNSWTDAFGQLHEGSGRAVDGKAAEQWWMESWHNFTQSWWVAGSAAYGQFIAYISRGRNLREVILYTAILPVFYCLIWFCIWGGIGLRQSRQALEMQSLGETYFNDSAYFMLDGNEYCYQIPQTDLVIGDAVVFTNRLPGVTPVCRFDEENPDSAVLNVLNSFHVPGSLSKAGMGPSLSVLFMLASAMLYLTVAGSVALIVDKMASSGRKNYHLARRMFWVLTVGALATALLFFGGGDALTTLQAAIIVCGLPFIVLLCYLLQCIVLYCDATARLKRKSDYEFPNQPEFIMPVYGGIFNIIEFVFSMGRANESRTGYGMDRPTRIQVVEFLKAIFVPFISMHQVLMSIQSQSPKANLLATIVYGVCYTTWLGLLFASNSHPGLSGMKWVLFTVNGFAVAMLRSYFRSMYNIRSNAVGDLVSGTFLWPQVWTQLRLQCYDNPNHGPESNQMVDEPQDEPIESEESVGI